MYTIAIFPLSNWCFTCFLLLHVIRPASLALQMLGCCNCLWMNKLVHTWMCDMHHSWVPTQIASLLLMQSNRDRCSTCTVVTACGPSARSPQQARTGSVNFSFWLARIEAICVSELSLLFHPCVCEIQRSTQVSSQMHAGNEWIEEGRKRSMGQCIWKTTRRKTATKSKKHNRWRRRKEAHNTNKQQENKKERKISEEGENPTKKSMHDRRKQTTDKHVLSKHEWLWM